MRAATLACARANPATSPLARSSIAQPR